MVLFTIIFLSAETYTVSLVGSIELAGNVGHNFNLIYVATNHTVQRKVDRTSRAPSYWGVHQFS